MRCQFCKEELEDVNALQLHQVAFCPAMNRSTVFEAETLDVVFKWLVDRVTKVPSVFLICSNMEDNIELKKFVGCFKSVKVTMSTGKYSGQLVIGHDILSLNNFEITPENEVVHLIVNNDNSVKDSSLEESMANHIERDVDYHDAALDEHDCNRRRQSASIHGRDNGSENVLSPLHQEMLDHQIKNDYDFGDTQVNSKLYCNILSEESVKRDTAMNSKSNEPTLHQARGISPDFSRVSCLPRDSDGDDSFYHSFASPSVFERIDPDSSPSTPTINPGSFGNIGDLLFDLPVKDEEGIISEPSMQSHVAEELISHELEDAMQDTTPGSLDKDVDTLGESDANSVIDENLDVQNISFDYAGNPMSIYDRTDVHEPNPKDHKVDNQSGNHLSNKEIHRFRKREKQIVKTDDREKEKMHKEMQRMANLIENYKEVKIDLETKCASYDQEVQRLKMKCDQLVQDAEHSNLNQVEIDKKDRTIDDMKVKAESYESEIGRLNQELHATKEKLEEHKIEKLQLETKCGRFDLEVKQLSDKCQELNEQKGEIDVLCKEASKSKAYKTEIKRLDMELQKINETVTNYQQEKVLLESKCVTYESELKQLRDKCTMLMKAEENQSANESVTIKDRIIADMKVKADSYESELNRLQQEVKNLTELNKEYKKIKHVLGSKCNTYENEIESLKGNHSSHEQHQKVNDMVKVCQELELKCKELQNSNQKLLDDYNGLEGAKIVYEEEVSAERERYERQIKELMDEKLKLINSNKQDNKYSENNAKMNINKLKSENKILKEKLNLICNESEFNESTAKENISPRLTGYKPPVVPSAKSYEPESKVNNSQSRSSRSSRHKHTSSNEEYTLPSRYNANKYSTSTESYDKSELVSHVPENIRPYTSDHLENIMRRYSNPINIPSSQDSLQGRSRTRPHSYHDPLSFIDTTIYKPKSFMTVPFCPTSVKELSVGMKISVNRANGRLSRGTVRWIGTLPRHSGDYVGVELESEVGKHDGNLNGIQYFKCKGDRGIFVKFPKVIMAWK